MNKPKITHDGNGKWRCDSLYHSKDEVRYVSGVSDSPLSAYKRWEGEYIKTHEELGSDK